MNDRKPPAEQIAGVARLFGRAIFGGGLEAVKDEKPAAVVEGELCTRCRGEGKVVFRGTIIDCPACEGGSR